LSCYTDRGMICRIYFSLSPHKIIGTEELP
jgi:hypothetical protein